MAVDTPTDRPKSVRNLCVIEVLVAFLCCQLIVECSVGLRVFVIGLSQISLFFSIQALHNLHNMNLRRKLTFKSSGSSN